MAKSAMERIRELDEERKRIMETAYSEARAAAEAAIESLNSLGRRFRLVEEGERGNRRGTRQVKDAPCKICGFRTQPPHDARAHRAQGRKKPFTPEELEARGLKKVS